MVEPSTPLREQLRDLKYSQRLDQASLVAQCADKEERVAVATAIIRELAMQRVFDRLTREQDAELLGRFAALAELGEADYPASFGGGATNSISDK